MKLTKQNYFTNKNRYLSNSKIRDYLKCPRYFYEKNVLGTREKEPTDSLIIGTAVDMWLTGGGRAEFEKNYIRVERRSKGGSVGPMIELTGSVYDDIVAMCEAVEQTTAYHELKGFKTQQILQHDEKIGVYFDGICGIPDFFKINKKDLTSVIVDLKTARTIDAKKYYFHAMEFGYFRQQAMYQMLINFKYGINKIVSKHIVVEKDGDKIFNVQTFVLDQDIIEEEKLNLKRLLGEIGGIKEFAKQDTSFSVAIKLTRPGMSMEVEEATKENWGE